MYKRQILNAAGPKKEYDEKILKKLGKLKKKNVIRVCVSLSCHHCQSVVTAGQTLALLSPNVECVMIDARLYPDLVEKYKPVSYTHQDVYKRQVQ